MKELPKKSQAQGYLEEVSSKVENIKIKSIFSFESPWWNTHSGYRSYMLDGDLNILFENEMCLRISYLFVDALQMEFKKITKEEKEKYETLLVKDYFNGSQDITDFYTKKITHTESIKLDYDSIKSVSIHSVTEEYEKWLDGDIDYVKPNAETFDEITFVMSNGYSFTICADDASSDGYMRVWSVDAECNTTINE